MVHFQREGYSALQEKVKESLAEMKRNFKAHVIKATKLELATENKKPWMNIVKASVYSLKHIALVKTTPILQTKSSHTYFMNKETTSYFPASIVSMNSNGNTWKYTS